MSTSRTLTGSTALALASLIALSGCAAANPASEASSTTGPVVVATTTWQGAFAKAAGAEQITVIAPSDAQHAAEYDPSASDLTEVAGADFVLYSEFESFAPKITEAADSDAEALAVNADNTPANVIAEVTRLGEAFGTEDAAAAWVSTFEEELDSMRAELVEAAGGKQPKILSQVYVQWLADLVSTDVTTFGPAALTTSEVLAFTQAEPAFVFANVHMSSGVVLPDSSAVQVGIVNYPGESLDLIELYHSDVDRVVAALNGEPVEDGGTHEDSGSHGDSDHSSGHEHG